MEQVITLQAMHKSGVVHVIEVLVDTSAATSGVSFTMLNNGRSFSLSFGEMARLCQLSDSFQNGIREKIEDYFDYERLLENYAAERLNNKK